MWMLGRIHFQVCYIPYKHSCPVRGRLSPLPTFVAGMQMLASLTDICGRYADACLPYRHLWPVCRYLPPLPPFMARMQMLVSLTDIYGRYADACLPYRHCSPECEFAFRCVVGAARIVAPRRAMPSPAPPPPTDQLLPYLLYRVGCRQQLLRPSSGLYMR
jgi:hypothetical protein